LARQTAVQAGAPGVVLAQSAIMVRCCGMAGLPGRTGGQNHALRCIVACAFLGRGWF
jgi:hypothetical protein